MHSYAPILKKENKHRKSVYQMQHCIHFEDDTQIIPKTKKRKLAPIRVEGHMKDKCVLSTFCPILFLKWYSGIYIFIGAIGCSYLFFFGSVGAGVGS
jgi:hypothetical protein